MNTRFLIRLLFDSIFFTSILLLIIRLILLPFTNECDDDEQ